MQLCLMFFSYHMHEQHKFSIRVITQEIKVGCFPKTTISQPVTPSCNSINTEGNMAVSQEQLTLI